MATRSSPPWFRRGSKRSRRRSSARARRPRPRAWPESPRARPQPKARRPPRVATATRAQRSPDPSRVVTQLNPSVGRLRHVKPLVVLLAAVVAGCSSPAQDPSVTTSPSLHAWVTPSASASTAPKTATELLECDAGPSDVGGSGAEVAVTGGETPDEAVAAFLAESPFVVPYTGYEALGQSGDRHAYGYRSDGKVKAVLVVSPRFGELVGARFAPDALHIC